MTAIPPVIEDVDTFTKQIKFTILRSDFEDQLQKLAKQAQAGVKVRGFRPGKAPLELVLKLHGVELKSRAISQLSSDLFLKIVREHKIPVVGRPDVEMDDYSAIYGGDSEKDLNFTAKVVVMPQPDVVGLDEIVIDVPRREVEEKDVEELLNVKLKQHATYDDVLDRTTVEAGDVVEGEVSVKMGAYRPSKPEPYTFDLSERRVAPEFEQALIGKEIGETVVVPVEHPDNHPIKRLRGRKAEYFIKVLGLRQPVLPEITTEVIREIDATASSAEELRQNLRQRLFDDSQKAAERSILPLAIMKLADINIFDLPQKLVDLEIKRMLLDAGFMSDPNQEIPEEHIEGLRSAMGEMAAKNSRQKIIVDRLVDQLGIKASDEEVQTWFVRNAPQIARSKDKPSLEDAQYTLAREKVYDLIKEKAQVNYVKAEQQNPDAIANAAIEGSTSRLLTDATAGEATADEASSEETAASV